MPDQPTSGPSSAALSSLSSTLQDKPLKRFVVYPITGALATLAFHIFRLVPIRRASGFVGRVAKWLGPKLSISKRARRNLIQAFPEKTTAEIDRLVWEMWESLGQTAAEFCHMDRFDTLDPDHIEIVGAEHLEAMRDDGETALMFSAHLANWEVAGLAAIQRGMDLIGIYRRANNPLVERLFLNSRGWPEGSLIPKSERGARQCFIEMRRGRHLCLLMDQKLNEGIEVPFFGRPAMTSTMLAKYALYFRCPVHPVSIRRMGLCRYRLEVEEAIPLPETGDTDKDVEILTRAATDRIEAWVRRDPSQWLWLHNRWKA